MSKIKRLNTKKGPRSNLPWSENSRNGEDKFARRFAVAYSQNTGNGQGVREFQLSSFGIADFVWVEALSKESCTIRSFEVKLKDWRRGLAQAYRYSFFSDFAYLVVPDALSSQVIENRQTFKTLNIGAISLSRTGTLNFLLEPKKIGPLSQSAKARAMSSLSQELKLSLFRK